MNPIDRKQFLKQTAAATLALTLFNKIPFARSFEMRQNPNVVYLTAKDSNYETLRKGFNKRLNNYPKVIALVNNNQGVVEAIKYAEERKLPVTVKSGGHCMEGFSGNDNGMVINVSLLNTIKIDGDVLTVGPAATLKSIYETIIPKGKYLPGGSCQSVAIGGLSLGGGYGLLSRKYGLTCDSLLSATMVDGQGNIVDTINNATLNWALKGGGNGNFGVVTEMKFKLQPAPKAMQSTKFRVQNVSVEKAIEVCKRWFELAPTLPNDCFSAFIYNGKTTYILLTNTGASALATKAFINEFKSSATKITEGQPLPLGSALKAYYAEANPITFKNASSGLYKSFSDIESIIQKVFELVKERPGILYQINTLGGQIKQEQFQKSSSFPHRDYSFFSELQAYWESASASPKFLAQFEKIQQQFASAGVVAQYRNYPDINFSNWAEQYYGQNLNQLRLIKKQFDPRNNFSGKQTL